MRIKHFFGLAVIATMTASCSSNNDLVVGGGNGSGENESGASYASITINLPTVNGTRATTNDQFDGGTASEYTVNDATLVIFEKGTETSEKNFKFVETVPLGNLEPWKNVTPANKGITTEATITAQLTNAKVDETGGKYYALVILNNETATGNKITLPSESTETYGTWNVATNTTNITDYTKGFYMANAPQFTAANVEPTTLVKIEGIYRTKEEAQSKPATTVHVERGLAKVTVSSNSTTNYFGDTGANASGANYSNDKIKITEWALDVTNKTSFPVHVTEGLSNDYTDVWKNELNKSDRFVSASTSFKRVYWGVDPNYKNTDLNDPTKEADRTTNFTYIKKGDISSKATDVAYCLENTFNLDNMKQGQTTRVVFKATYTPNGFTAADGSTFFKIGNHTELWSKTNLVKQIKTKAQEVLHEADADKIDVVLDAESNDVEKTAGTKTLTKANVKHNDAEVSEDEINKINERLGLKAATSTAPIVGITTYVNGESYYIARIKHFGDDLTPWNAGEDTYGANNEKYLGRYGVLRNNWYDLTVNSISGPGYPDVPEIKPNTSDDEDTKYISVSVKILDWAKRSQDVNL